MKNIEKIIKIFTKHFSWLLVIAGYTIISLIFNYRVYWHQLVSDLSKSGAVWGEVQVYEWALEKFYQTLISGHNPFGSSISILYPFGLNFSMLDLGYGLFFPLLRPFLSPHQTISILVTVSLIVANIGMYMLLRKLNFSKIISFIIGAAYGYMTFLMPRGGHLSYWSIFLFPWFYFFITSFFIGKNNKNKILLIIGSSIIFVLTLWLNFYYFVILLISIFSLFLYYLLFNKEFFLKKLKENMLFLLLKGVIIFILLIPWLTGLYDMFMFDQVPRTSGWSGAIEFASDLFNYFIPSVYGYFINKFPILYKPFTLFLQLFSPNARSIFENFTYPGVIILISYFILIFFFKKFDKTTRGRIKPFLFASIVFLILTLGPFLHVFGHWTLTVDEGIKIVIPLPYIILHYIPFLNNIRVPGRLIVGFIFFAYIVCAYLINHLLKSKSAHFKKIFFVILFLIFFIDQRVTDNAIPDRQIYPYKIFKTIKVDKDKFSVLEVPFTVRDGFTYFGNGDAIGMTVGQLWYDKPVLGGYIGRIADYKKNYYRLNPFLGYIGRVIDEGLLVNPIIDKEDLINWQKIDIANSKRTIDFLDIKYLINNDGKSYSALLSAVYQDSGYEKKLIDGGYSLWETKSYKNEFKSIRMNNPIDTLFLGFGWYNIEDGFRWMDRRGMVMFKITKKRKLNLNFRAESIKENMKISIYLNKEKAGEVILGMSVKDYQISIDKDFIPGINTIHFISDKAYVPAKIFSGLLDQRKLSAKFSKIYLTEK
ncbi:hypothetical protein HZA75_03945 [Candidatus Roizmanbacteria bacterium]|nr:hypothetical protein [Candidatus Roizmanbacteria bacterium]